MIELILAHKLIVSVVAITTVATILAIRAVRRNNRIIEHAIAELDQDSIAMKTEQDMDDVVERMESLISFVSRNKGFMSLENQSNMAKLAIFNGIRVGMLMKELEEKKNQP